MERIAKNTEYIKNFSLDDCPTGNKGYKRVLLQLFGFMGHGKSSFINSCKYVLEGGEFKVYTDASGDDGGSTTKRISYPLTDTLTLVDNRGCSTMNNYEMSEIFAQLGNLLPLDKKITWSKKAKELRDRIIEAEKEIKSSDFIFPIFVYSVKKGIDQDEAEEFKELLTIARDLTGIFPIIVLTHKMHPNLKDMVWAFKSMGAEQIFPLENFTREDHVKTRGKHEEILRFFTEVINDIKFRVEQFYDPEMEKQKRKKFVLDFLHDKELEKEQEEFRRQAEEHKRLYENALKKERQRAEEERQARHYAEEQRRQVEAEKNGRCLLQ